jgi:nucleotide-binding universal stress UspA family protein
MHRILVATDGSADADRALHHAIAVARAFDCELTIMTIEEVLTDGDLERLAAPEHTTRRDILDREARATLLVAQKAAADRGVGKTHLMSGFGSPALAIVATARQIGADLIVVGRRGRGQLAGIVLGSTSQKLATVSPCPVTIVP